MAAAAAKTIVLVTGANNGIGFELAAQLMAKGSTYHVLVGARSSEKGGAALRDLQSRNYPGSAELLLIDATRDDTIAGAAAAVERAHGKLDWLVNNAAVASQAATLREQLREEFDTNATGPAVIASVFAPLLRKSSASPRIVNVSSGAGSIGRRLDPSSALYARAGVQYRASKAALNMVSACQAVELGPAIKVFAYCPGFTVSGLSAHNTAANGARSTRDSVLSLMDVLEGRRDEEAGGFLHNTGSYPW